MSLVIFCIYLTHYHLNKTKSYDQIEVFVAIVLSFSPSVVNYLQVITNV